MFTGIVAAQGRVVEVRDAAVDRDLVVESAALANDLCLGASIALDGCCQTVTELVGDRFTVHAMAETLRVTTLGRYTAGDSINLELPVGAGQPMGGHFVQGHVDGVGTIQERTQVGDAERWRFSADPELVAQMVPKGSVAVDGVSLTVGPDLGMDHFEIFLIPHTLDVTTFGAKLPGDAVNIETDVLGKYLLRFLRRDSAPGIGWDDLRRVGFEVDDVR